MNNMPELLLDLSIPYIKDKSKSVQCLDIETSLVKANIFSTGTQTITIDQIEGETKVLTVAGGSLYDLQTKGIKGVWSVSNHRSANFKNDPLDDTEVLKHVWMILDNSDTIIAHNARFDSGWLNGRFLSLGWQLPSPYTVFCTYRNLYGFNFLSKKLDHLSQQLCGTKKVKSDIGLWRGCGVGDVESYKKMEQYNIGDIYDTLYKVWRRTAYYNPNHAIDMTNPASETINCRVDGLPLYEREELYMNKNTGKEYQTYVNPRAGIIYRDRYMTTSKNAGTGKVVAL